MSRLMVPAAAVAAAAAIVTAGCASAGASGPGAGDGAPTIVPSNAVAFIAASTDLASSHWHGLGKAFLTKFQTIAPALGDELDVAVLPDKQIVGLTQPKDGAKLTALAAKHGLRTRTIGAWTAIAKTAAALDALTNAKSHLADNALFTAAMDRLPGNALVRAYASPAEAQQLLAAIPGVEETIAVPNGVHYRLKASVATDPRVNVGTTDFRWIAAAVTSTSDGLKVEAFAKSNGLTAPAPPRYIQHPTPPYTSALIDEIPAGALAVVDLKVAQGMFENLPKLPAALTKLFGSTGAELPVQLDTLLGGETAIYVRPSLPTPEVTLVTQPTDTVAASIALDQIQAELPPSNMLSGLKLYRTILGGQLVVSTTQRGLDALRSGGPKLSTDPSFLAAQKQSGMGAETTGFVYANVKDALPLLALAGVKLPAGLPSLGNFMAYGGATADESTFTAFLGVG
jgi:hypothetical protein